MPLHQRDLEAVRTAWPQLGGATLTLINHSENHTFRADLPGGERFCLRVHRPAYQSPVTIESELTWLAALERDTDLPLPQPVPGANGRLLQTVTTAAGESRNAVLFRFIAGTEPAIHAELTPLFATLGDYAARLHAHTLAWPRPAGFVRQAWNAATILDPDGLWGDWRVAPGVDGAIRPLLDRLDTELRTRLAAYGTSSERYGLIHADMRLGNLLVDGDTVSLIDFDDCGFCWFTYDFAAAISFHETHASVPDLREAWLSAYQTRRPLSAADIASLDSMVMLRRMALLTFIGSHIETELAQTHLPGFAAGTAELAERYLGGAIWPD